MPKTIKEVKDFTKRMDGASEVIVSINGTTDLPVDAMSIIRTEECNDIVVLHASMPFDEETDVK